jgi:DNA-directed RNA polymerase specialized sigma24 family protein
MQGAAKAPHPYAERLAHPMVRAKIVQIIGRRVPAAEAEDIAQKAFVRLLLTQGLPENPTDLVGYAAMVVHRLVIDHHRARRRNDARREDGMEVDEIVVEDGAPAVEERAEWRQMLAFAQKEAGAGRIPADVPRWASELAAGKTIEQIAHQEGRSPSAIKMAMKRARDHLRRRWPLYAAGASAALLLLWIRNQEPAMVSAPNPYARGSASATEPPEMRAQTYRDKAARECRDGAFDACERDLDEAKKADPASENRPDVKEMRQAIERSKRAR